MYKRKSARCCCRYQAGSKTFLQYHAEELSAENKKMLVIPEGFAHGFQALEENSELLYLVTAFYNKKSESGIYCQDPQININWKLPVTEISEKDKNAKRIDENFKGLKL
jgi:dTDP-4-dehydrorhamnose 3,5-epimerase